jgi:hypothetical protein
MASPTPHTPLKFEVRGKTYRASVLNIYSRMSLELMMEPTHSHGRTPHSASMSRMSRNSVLLIYVASKYRFKSFDVIGMNATQMEDEVFPWLLARHGKEVTKVYGPLWR